MSGEVSMAAVSKCLPSFTRPTTSYSGSSESPERLSNKDVIVGD